MPKFSIIVPVYNTEKYVKECIDSILSQTCSDFELIVIDDGSSDRSVEIVEDAIKNYPYCKLVRRNHNGVCCARNYGIEVATGDYISFVDSDDILYPDYIESLSKAAETYEPDVIYFHALYGTQADRKRPNNADLFTVLTRKDIQYLSAAALYHTPEVDNANGKYFGINSFSACMQVYKRSMYLDHNVRYTSGVKRSEDGLLNLEILNYAHSGVIIKKLLYIYRMDNISATRSYIPDLDVVFDLRDACVKTVINRLYSDRKSEYMEKYYSSLIYQMRVVAENQIFNSQNPKRKREKMEEFVKLISKSDYSKAVNTCNAFYLAPEDRTFLSILLAGEYKKIPQIIKRNQLKANLRRRLKRWVYPLLKKLKLK